MKPYYTSCGPAVVASVLGIHRLDAADKLRQIKKPTGKGNNITQMLAIGKVLNLPVHKILTQRPTLIQWLHGNRDEMILRASSHFYHVRNSEIIESNGLIQPRARVTHIIQL